jgi:hypothetical protein
MYTELDNAAYVATLGSLRRLDGRDLPGESHDRARRSHAVRGRRFGATKTADTHPALRR